MDKIKRNSAPIREICVNPLNPRYPRSIFKPIKEKNYDH
jgi:hypothetical protein